MPRSPPLASSDKLNANAQPFVPPEVKEEQKTPWQRQADMLTTRKPVVITDPNGNPVDLSPPSSAATPPSLPTPVQQPTPVLQHRTTPIMSSVTPPLSYKTPPSMYRSPLAGPLPGMPPLKAKCPSGHPLKLTVGSQMVCRDSGLVLCGSVFCRRCDQEELDKNAQGYYTCGVCSWDCCLLCASLPYTPVTGRQNVPPGVPPMPPLPASLKPPPPYADEVLQSIHGLLAELKEDAPCGLSTMPTNRLLEYEAYLHTRLTKSGPTPTGYDTYQGHKKVNVMKAEEYMREKRRERAAQQRQLAYAVKDRVMFVGGGRFPGNKKWKDGAKLTVGEIGVVKEVDLNEKFPLKCQFENVYVMLTEDDLEEAPPEPVKAKKEKKEKKSKEKPKRESGGKPEKQQEKERAKPAVPKVEEPKPVVVQQQQQQQQTVEHITTPAPVAAQAAAPPQAQTSIVIPLTMAAAAVGLSIWLLSKRKRH